MNIVMELSVIYCPGCVEDGKAGLVHHIISEIIFFFINIFSTQLCGQKGQKEKYACQPYILLSIIKKKFHGHITFMLKYTIFDLDRAHFDCIFLVWSILFILYFWFLVTLIDFFYYFFLLLIVLLADPGEARGCSTNSLMIH